MYLHPCHALCVVRSSTERAVVMVDLLQLGDVAENNTVHLWGGDRYTDFEHNYASKNNLNLM